VTPERRRQALLALLALVVVFALWRWLPALVPEVPAPAPPRAAAAGRPGRPMKAGQSALEVRDVVELRLGALEVEPVEFQVGRDPFRFGPAPAPPPPPPPTADELAALEDARRRAEDRARQVAVENAKPRPPVFDLTYLGSFGPAGRRVAVFSDKGRQEILNARRGEVLRGKFILDEIGLESVSLKFVGFPEVPAQRVGIGG
jgi:hypothetical protein